jgi:predicted transcriptional regulator
MSKANPKKKTSFSISENVDSLLSKLAEKHSRSKASMLEVLVKDAAARQAITL